MTRKKSFLTWHFFSACDTNKGNEADLMIIQVGLYYFWYYLQCSFWKVNCSTVNSYGGPPYYLPTQIFRLCYMPVSIRLNWYFSREVRGLAGLTCYDAAVLDDLRLSSIHFAASVLLPLNINCFPCLAVSMVFNYFYVSLSFLNRRDFFVLIFRDFRFAENALVLIA